MPSTRQGLRVLESHVYRGPSVWGYRPLIRFVLDLGALEERPSSHLPDFVPRLLERLPGLREHGCASGEPGAFVRRLEEGTWLGHVIEHVALELQTVLGTPVSYGKTRGVPGRRGVYDVVYSHRDERLGLLAGRLAVRLVDDLLPAELRGARGLDELLPEGIDPPEAPGAPFDLARGLEALARVRDRYGLGPSTRALVEAAEARGIPWRRLDDDSLIRFGHGARARQVRASVTDRTSAVALDTASDKALSNRLLADAGVPVPRQEIVRDADAAARAAARLGPPLAVKPADGNHGKGVSLGLRDEAAVRDAFGAAARVSPRVVVEEHLPGHDHRLLVVGGRLVAAARRVPAHVVGDGRSSVEELVAAANRDPRRGDGHDRPLTRLVLDEAAERLLAAAGHARDAVPAAGERVFLRATANLSTGGTAVDVTDEVHPAVAEDAARAARAIGLDVAGVDVVAPDLRTPLRESGGAVVEVNACPGLRMHVAPSEGRPRDVAGPILDLLFPAGDDGRIPILAVTGTNGKTTTARMLARIVEAHGRRVGLATTSGIRIGERTVVTGDTTGPWSARLVLEDPTVDVAVLETARGGLLRGGLAFDRCDVGCVLNVQEDHLGADGIETLDDMAWVKSLLVEVVDPGGHAVLNADDPRTLAMRERARGRLVLFSMEGGADGPGRLDEHVRAGGVAVVRQPSPRGDLLAVYDGGRQLPVVWSHEIPATLGGKALVNVQNALAAIAMGYAAGVPVATMARALRGFASTYEENPGRLNLYEEHPFRVLLDYGHNADGLAAMADVIAHLKGEGRAIGVITMVGDRRDEDVVRLGRTAAALFDRVIVREDASLRGRRPGEIAGLVRGGLREAGFPAAAVDTVLPEGEALEAALRAARPGDLVVHFAEDVEGAWRRIAAFRPSLAPPAAREDAGLPKGL